MKTLPTTCLSVNATAEYLGVTAVTIRRLISRKELAAHRVGRRVVVSPEALREYLAANPA
jgi:excisionase family DNA binding protein